MTAPARLGTRYLVLFASLYALQGVVFAYFFNFNQLYMTSTGVAATTAQLTQSVALLPFILKFLFGPLSDRFNPLGMGHRRPFILFGLILQSLGLVGLSLIDPSRHLPVFTAVAIFTVVGLSCYETCCDGMVIDTAPPEDRPRVQGTLVAARFLAAMVCSLGFGLWLDRAGASHGPARFHHVLWTCSALALVPFALGLYLPEHPRHDGVEEFNWSALRVLMRPHSVVLLVFGAFYASIGYGVEINLSLFYKNSLLFREGDIGALASARYIGRAVGAALLPLAMRRARRSRVLTLGIVGLAATTGIQSAIRGRFPAALGGFAFGAANGWDDALFYVLAMEASDPRMAASTYALFLAVTNVSILGGWLFAYLVTHTGPGYGPAFLLAALATLGALLLVPVLGRPAPKPESGHDDA